MLCGSWLGRMLPRHNRNRSSNMTNWPSQCATTLVIGSWCTCRTSTLGNRKLALPYHGPYCVIEVWGNGVSVRPVDKPEAQPILVNVDRVTPCPAELPDVSWLGSKKKRWRAPASSSKKAKEDQSQSSARHGYNLRSHDPPKGV